MTPKQTTQPDTASLNPATPRLFGWILILFAGSGCAALIYEVVWFQLLQLVIGSSTVSLGLLLGAYMGGLCLGSIAAPRFVSSRYHPLRVYAALELGIGVLGILVFFAIPYVGRLYVAAASDGFTGLLLRGVVAAMFLLPPTLLMGATLPAVARWLETTKVGVSRLGFWYGANIGGAVFGCLLAGFYLLRVYDMAVATYAAAAINAVVALVSFLLARRTGFYRAPAGESIEDFAARAPGSGSLYLGLALAGLGAMGAQVVWTRLLSLMLGATVYTFSIILAVFLIGLGAGAAIGSSIVRRTAHPRRSLGICLLCLAAAVAWTAYMLANSLPYWPIDPWLSSSPWFNFQVDLLRTLWAILPATVLWGATFPLALEALARPGQDPAPLAGKAYAADTVGAIFGAILFSLVLIPRLGTRSSQQLLIGLSAGASLIVLLPLAWRSSTSGKASRETGLGWKGVGGLAAAIGVCAALVWSVSELPWQAVAYGRRAATLIRTREIVPGMISPANILYRAEGINSSLLITEESGLRVFYVSGKSEASTGVADMRLQRLIGHMPALLHANPRDVLIVGFGSGVTAGSFVPYPEVEKIVITEIESLVPPATGRFFHDQNYGVLEDRRTRVVYDDARHYILTARETFDVITSDPIHPWVKGTSTLYSKEYFELVRRHLKPGGVAAQWLPLYDSDMDTVKSVLATFFEVFPGGTVWSNHNGEQGYDLVLIGQADESATIDVDALQRRLVQRSYAAVASSLREVGFHSAIDVLATYAGRASDLRPWLTGAQINLDRNLRLQYLAGMGLNSTAFPQIYRDLIEFRRYPEGLFRGSKESIQALKSALQTPR